MIKLNVETLWLGNAAIRDKYVAEASTKGEIIEITYKGKQMTIPYEELKLRMIFKSPRPFIDKFSKESHFLCYFKWREDTPKGESEPKQEKLI